MDSVCQTKVGAKSIARFLKSMYFLSKRAQALGMLESSSFCLSDLGHENQ
jgi:hypothetical protein